MKTNIKMRVTPEQSMKVQNIVIANLNTQNKVATTDIHFPYIVISTMGTFGTRDMEFYKIQTYKEIDSDLFIRTNGTCKEEDFYEAELYNDGDLIIKDDNIHMIGKDINKHNEIKDGINEWAKQFNDIKQKQKKKNEILKKARIKRKNQREELNKLNLKLQKCISFEEHHQVVDELKKDINFRNETIKNTLQIGKDRLKEIEQLKAEIEFKNEIIKELEDLNRMLKQDGAIKDLSISKVEEQQKEIKKLKAVIEYLESKVK